MNQSSDTIWDRVVAWFRGLFGTPAGQGGATGADSGSGGRGSLKDKASQAANRAQGAVNDLTARAKGAAESASARAQNTVDNASKRASNTGDQASDRTNDAGDAGKSRLSGAAASVTSRGYDTGTKVETSDATIEDMDASGQESTGGSSSTSAGASGSTAEDLDQTGTDTAERARSGHTGANTTTGGGTGTFSENDVTSEENAPNEVGEGVTYSPNPQEHPEADQAATDVGSSGRPFANEGDDWWDTDRPGMGTGSSLGEQGAGSETGTEGSGGDLGPSASAADVGTSTAGASSSGVDARGSGTGGMSAGGTAGTSDGDTGGVDYRAGGSGSAGDGGSDGGPQTYSASAGSTSTMTSTAATDDTSTPTAAGTDPTLATSETSAEDIVAGYGESGEVTADTSSVGVDSPDTAPGVGYEGSSPATDREGVGSYAPSAATGGGTGASSNDLGLVQEAPDDAEARAADQADAAAAGTAWSVDETGDADSGTSFDEQADTGEDYSTAQDIVVGGLIAEDQQETGGDYTDELLVDAESQQTELPAADYEDLPTDTADTTEDVTTTLGDQTTPAQSQASMTGTTGRGQTPDTAEGSEAAYEAEDGAVRDAGAGAGAATGSQSGTNTVSGHGASSDTDTVEEVDANAPRAGVKGVNWVPGDGGTEAPEGFPLKGNASSMIYHPKESATYARTIAEYYFATPEDAEAAGYRLPKSLQTNGETPASGRSTAAGVATDTEGSTATRTRSTSQGTSDATAQASQAHTAAVSSGQTGKTGQQNGAKQTGGKAERPAPKGAIRAQGSACPDDHPIKGNANSRIYHMPSESSYEQTIPEFCFATEADAKAAGFRARKH